MTHAAAGMASAMSSGGHGSGGSSGKIGMATTVAPMIAGMMSGNSGKIGGHHGTNQGPVYGSSSHQSGVGSSGTMAAVGAIATAGLSYYEARKGKKHQKDQSTAAKRGMSLDAFMQQTNAKDAKKVSQKAKKLGLTPEQY